MYALKARDKLHKREKEERKEREKEALRRSRELDAYHRGEAGHDPEVTAAGRRQPATTRREAKYIGTSSIEMRSETGWKSDIGKSVKQQLSRTNTKNCTSSIPVMLLVNMEGVKVITADGQNLIMAHALKRILFCTADTKKSLFAMVARNPQTGADGVYCHVFLLPSKEKASELSELVGKAFKAAFTKNSLKREKKKKKSQQPQRTPSPKASSQQPQRTPSPKTSSQQPQRTPSPKGFSRQPQRSPSPQAPPYQPSAPSYPTPNLQDTGMDVPVVQTGQLVVAVCVDYSHKTPRMSREVPPPSGYNRRSGEFLAPSSTNSELLQEASQLEGEILGLHTKVHQIESQLILSGEDERVALELTMQLSSYQQQLDERGRRLLAIQQSLQGAAGGSSTGPERGGLAFGSNRHSGSSLPDIDSISLEDAQWFQAGIPRELAMEILSQEGEGAFIVRQSTSKPGCYALSLKTLQGKIVNYLIEVDSGGLHLQGSTRAFPTLVSLILHHCVNQEILPCTLNLGNCNPTFLEGDVPTFRGEADSDSDVDDNDYLTVHPYQLLGDS